MLEQKRNITRYSPEFRDEAVRFVISSGDSVANVATKLIDKDYKLFQH